jgi:hypothetical protein
MRQNRMLCYDAPQNSITAFFAQRSIRRAGRGHLNGSAVVTTRMELCVSNGTFNQIYYHNDPRAVQAILDSGVPLVIGPGDVCRASLSLSLDQAKEMIASRGPIGAWLWEEFQAWYYRYVKPLRVNDFSKPWIIWDNITLAYVLGMTEQQTSPRPRLKDDFTFEPAQTNTTVT